MHTVRDPRAETPSRPEGPGARAHLDGARRGDVAAAHAFLLALLPRVRNLIRYIVRGDPLADDMAQEALVAIHRGLAAYEERGTLEAWVDRIVARAVFAGLRARRRERALESSGVQLDLVPDPHEGPDEYLARRQAVRQLDAIPDEQRHALVLHHVVGMSVPEIAGTLGTSPDTVKSRLRLGKARLLQLAGVGDPPKDER